MDEANAKAEPPIEDTTAELAPEDSDSDSVFQTPRTAEPRLPPQTALNTLPLASGFPDPSDCEARRMRAGKAVIVTNLTNAACPNKLPLNLSQHNALLS